MHAYLSSHLPQRDTLAIKQGRVVRVLLQVSIIGLEGSLIELEFLLKTKIAVKEARPLEPYICSQALNFLI